VVLDTGLVRFSSKLMVFDAEMERLVGEKVTPLNVAAVVGANDVVQVM